MIGSRLDGFKEVRDSLYRFRCPFCGDSKKKKSKARGHFYEKDGHVFMKCFNCEYSTSFENFLREYDINLYNEFKIENLRSKGKSVFSSARNKEKSEHATFNENLLKTHVKFTQQNSIEGTILTSASSQVIEYAESRKIPHKFYDYLYETDAQSFAKSIKKYKESEVFSQTGLLIPFFYDESHHHYALFRSIKSKFFMVFEVNQIEIPKIWGMNIAKDDSEIFVTESPIDAMMIDNSIAMGGVGDFTVFNFINKKYSDVTYILDNDYEKNIQVMSRLSNLIKSNSKVVIYDKKFKKFKDLNDAIVNGRWSHDSLENYIRERTFRGPMAMLELAKAKKF